MVKFQYETASTDRKKSTKEQKESMTYTAFKIYVIEIETR